MTNISRRGIIAGMGALLAAPVIVRAANLMPVRGIVMPVLPSEDVWRPVKIVRYVVEGRDGRRFETLDLETGVTEYTPWRPHPFHAHKAHETFKLLGLVNADGQERYSFLPSTDAEVEI